MTEKEKELAEEIVTQRTINIFANLGEGNCPFKSAISAPKKMPELNCDKWACGSECRRLYLSIKKREIRKEVYEKFGLAAE